MKATALLASWILLVFVTSCSREPQMIITDSSGRSIVVDKVNSGVSNAIGNFAATVSVNYPDGSPASGQRYRLELPLPSTNIIASKGILSTNGEVTIGGLAGGFPPVIYYFYVEDVLACSIAIDSNNPTNRFEGLLPAEAGMRAPDLALLDLADNRKFRLTDLRGQIVFLEFYTTRCVPCQPVLAKLDKLLERRGAAWQGKVTVLAVGLDPIWQPDGTPDTVKEHLRRKGWDHLHPVVLDEVFSWEPAKQFPFGVNAVPHSFLIGGDGVILWSGFPEDREIERRIDELVKREFQ